VLKILIFRETELKELSPDVMNKQGMAGTENSVICLAQELSKYYTVKVCCPGLHKFYDSVEYISYSSYAEVFLICSMFKPDVLIASGNPNILFKMNFNVNKIIFWQQNHPLELLGRFNIKELLAKNISIVAPSPEAAEYYNKFYELKSIRGIYNGVRNEFFEVKNVIRKEQILYVGSFTRAKGLNKVIEAAKDLKEIQFKLCGSFDLYGFVDIEYKNYCLNEAKNLNNIEFIGSLNAQKLSEKLYESKFCIVNPLIGNHETCCVSALEAIVCKSLVITGSESITDKIFFNKGILVEKDLVSTIKSTIKNNFYECVANTKQFIDNLKWDKIALIWKDYLEQKCR
jgi:glycosyltransferase involved in cell wall biosynthesis